MIVLESKSFFYNYMNKIINTYKNNIRCKLALPNNNNNGTKIDYHMICRIIPYFVSDKKNSLIKKKFNETVFKNNCIENFLYNIKINKYSGFYANHI